MEPKGAEFAEGIVIVRGEPPNCEILVPLGDGDYDIIAMWPTLEQAQRQAYFINTAFEKESDARVKSAVDHALREALDSLRCPEAEKRKLDEPEFNGFQSALNWAVGQIENLRNRNSKAASS